MTQSIKCDGGRHHAVARVMLLGLDLFDHEALFRVDLDGFASLFGDLNGTIGHDAADRIPHSPVHIIRPHVAQRDDALITRQACDVAEVETQSRHARVFDISFARCHRRILLGAPSRSQLSNATADGITYHNLEMARSTYFTGNSP